MADSYVTPKELTEQTSLAETDEFMVTNAAAATKRFTASRFWTWVWNKIQQNTLATLNASSNAPVRSAAVNTGLAAKVDTSSITSTYSPTGTAPINGKALNGALVDLHKKLGEFAHSSSQSSEQFYVYKISGFQNIIGGNQSDMARITLQTRYTARLALNLIAYATAPTNCVKAELEDTNGVSNEKFEVKYDISNGKFDIYVKLTVGTFANRQVFFLENRTTGANNVTVTELTDDTSFVNAQYTCNVDEVITQKSLNDNLSDYQPYLHYYLNAGQEVDTGIFINQSLQSSKTYTRRKSFLVMLTSINGYGDTTSERLCIIKIGRSRNVIEVFTIHESLISTSGYFFNDLEFVSSSDDITDNNNNTLIIRNKSTVNNHYVAIDFLL